MTRAYMCSGFLLIENLYIEYPKFEIKKHQPSRTGAIAIIDL